MASNGSYFNGSSNLIWWKRGAWSSFKLNYLTIHVCVSFRLVEYNTFPNCERIFFMCDLAIFRHAVVKKVAHCYFIHWKLTLKLYTPNFFWTLGLFLFSSKPLFAWKTAWARSLKLSGWAKRNGSTYFQSPDALLWSQPSARKILCRMCNFENIVSRSKCIMITLCTEYCKLVLTCLNIEPSYSEPWFW